MKKMIRSISPFFLLAGLLFPAFLFSQANNLVPNSSFEQYKGLPDGPGEAAGKLAIWRIPVGSGPTDYYHQDAKSDMVRIPKNNFGYQKPHSGKAYAGICITKKSREYLQVDLLRPLEKGKQYEVKVFISCADRFGLSKVNEFGILFSQKKMFIPENEYMNIAPKIVFKKKNSYKNKKRWEELSVIYTADGTEKVMTFGSFLYQKKLAFEEDKTKHGKIKGLSKYAHYYVDDISIIPLVIDTAMISSAPIVLPKEEKKDSVPEHEFKIGNTYIFNNIQFETGKSKLLSKAFPELDDLITYLEQNKNTKIIITGHTDSMGDPEDNLKLSLERAKTVMLYLVSKNIDEERLMIEGKGDTYPIVSNDTDAGRERNRRVEISFL